MKRKIIKLPLQSFCFGVKNAILETTRILNNPHTIKPIYMLGEIVHNKHISDFFENQGIIVFNSGKRLDMIKKIDKGSVIFTAHGVSQQVIKEAQTKNLPFYNTTCPFVKNSIKLIEKYLLLDYHIIYIGSANHPESETALSLSPKVHLIESKLDVEKLHLDDNKIIVTNQTTMSIYDIMEIVDLLKHKFPNLLMMEKVCSASKERQEMVMDVALKHQNDASTAFIVVGDTNSHNSRKLADIIKKYNQNVFFVETIENLKNISLISFQTIYIASGTSTPLAIVDEIYDCLMKESTDFSSHLSLEDYVK